MTQLIVCGRVLMLGLMLSATQVSAGPITSLVVFGDSLVDAGSLQLAASRFVPPFDPTPESVGYFQGRFANGPNYADLLNQHWFGESTSSFLLGGGNYAFGGAAITTDVFGGAFGVPDEIPDFADQVGAYVGNQGGAAKEGALHLVNFGNNDMIAATIGVTSPTTFAATALTGVQTQLQRIIDAGGVNLLVANVSTVIGSEVATVFGANADGLRAVTTYNEGLSEWLRTLAYDHPQLNVGLLDLDAILANVFENPLVHEFDPALNGQRCINAGAASACTGYFWFDNAPHPTARVHEIVAASAIAAVPEPGTLMLLSIGLCFLGAMRYRRSFCNSPIYSCT